MGKFAFSAVDAESGKEISGAVNAACESDALDTLYKRGLKVLRIRRVAADVGTDYVPQLPVSKAPANKVGAGEFDGFPWLAFSAGCYAVLACLCLLAAFGSVVVGVIAFNSGAVAGGSSLLMSLMLAILLAFAAVGCMTLVDVSRLFVRMEKHLRKIASQ